MDFFATTTLGAAPARVFEEVCDLGTYPDWLSIVLSAVPDGDEPAVGPAWSVTIGARVGPFRKTKTVRMVRTERVAPILTRFERVEHDGGDHSPWVLTAEVDGDGAGTELTMSLHYGGSRLPSAVEKVLRDEMRRAGDRLDRRLATRRPA